MKVALREMNTEFMAIRPRGRHVLGNTTGSLKIQRMQLAQFMNKNYLLLACITEVLTVMFFMIG